MTKDLKLDRIAKDYILQSIDTEGRELDKEPTTAKERLQFLYNTFKSEYVYENNIKRYGSLENCFREWIMGLPSAFNIEFRNHKILDLAKQWGSITETSTERRKDDILLNWFNFIAIKTFQLFKHYKIER